MKKVMACLLALSLLLGLLAAAGGQAAAVIVPPAPEISIAAQPLSADLLLAEHDAPDSYIQPRVSRDGNAVAYISRVEGEEGVYIYDVAAGIHMPISQGGTPHMDRGLALSPTGRYVVYEGAGEVDAAGSVLYLFDRLDGSTDRLAQSEGRFRSLSVSEDGSRVAFVSEGGDLVEDDTNGLEDVFLLDLREDAEHPLKRISVGWGDEQGSEPSGEPMITADSEAVALVSRAPELWPGRDEMKSRLFTYYPDSGYLDYRGVTINEIEELDVYSPYISSDGSYIIVREMNGTQGIRLWLYSSEEGEFRELLDVSDVPGLSLGAPIVTDDGATVAGL
ncbi:TolB family protein [Paenibacillus sp. 1P07SE]|uniref:TolB family protein n=1 Tax=Paenibacillus sp. 1P07SE TaxID=3132209 RepID=UPI0039A5A622